MSDPSEITFQQLVTKIDQQEVVITQLLKIVASINQRMNQTARKTD